MEIFKNYFLCAVGALLIVEYARYLVADKFRPYVRFVSGLLIVLLIAHPAYGALTSFLNELPEIGMISGSDQLNGDYSGYIGTFKNGLITSVSDHIVSKTDLTYDDFNVDVELDDKDISAIKIKLIRITLFKSYDCRVISNIVSVLYNAETETVIEDEGLE